MFLPLRSTLAATGRVRAFAMSFLLVATGTFTGVPAPAATLANGDTGTGNAIWYVGPGGGSGTCATANLDFTTGVTGDGSDAAAIQAAVDAASSGDVVHLCDKTYDLTSGIVVDENLTFQGETTSGTEVSGGNSVQLFSAVANDVVFVGLTLRNGTASSGGAVVAHDVSAIGAIFRENTTGSLNGGAISASGDVTSASSVYLDNSSGGTSSGGAIAADGYVRSANDSFTSNRSTNGGALLAGAGLEVTHGTFTGNAASGSGGAVFVDVGNVTVTDSTFGTNVAAVHGGALFSNSPSATVVVLRSDFLANSAIGTNGGAIWASGDMTSATSTYVENSAGQSGGAIFTGGRIDSTNDDFEGNQALGLGGYGDLGGAIYAMGDITATGGTMTGNRAGDGGAFFSDATARVVGGIFSGNIATPGSGGAIRATTIDVTSGSQFLSNAASNSGGALYGQEGVEVRDADFLDNSAATGLGGAIGSNLNGAISIRSDFNANHAGLGGGAIAANGAIEIHGGSFADNTAWTESGGSILSEDSSVSVTDATFAANVAGTFGGAIRAVTFAFLEGVEFDGNQADQGGAVYVDASANISASTFAANVADGDGGAVSARDLVIAENVTFAGNQAAGKGGAVLTFGSGGKVEITHGTFVDNSASGSGDPGDNISTETLVLRRSVLAGGTCEFANEGASGGNLASGSAVDCPSVVASTDLKLGTLADNGGPTRTVALLAGSPAIDAYEGPCEVATDQRGVERPQGDGCDAGAFELKVVTTMAFVSGGGTSTVGTSVTFGVAIATSGTDGSGWRIAFSDGTTPISGCEGVPVAEGGASCTISTLGIGTHTIWARFFGTEDYEATSATVVQVVSADEAPPTVPAPPIGTTPQTITFTLPPYAYGATKAVPLTLKATASSTLEVSYSSTTPTTCRLVGKVLTPLSAGTCTVTASQAGDPTYAAASVTRSMTVITSKVRITLKTSFAVNGETRLSVPLIVPRGTRVTMSVTTGERAMSGKTVEVWVRYGTGRWQKLATKTLGIKLLNASFTFRARPDATYRWRWGGDPILHDQWSPSRRVLGL